MSLTTMSPHIVQPMLLLLLLNEGSERTIKSKEKRFTAIYISAREEIHVKVFMLFTKQSRPSEEKKVPSHNFLYSSRDVLSMLDSISSRIALSRKTGLCYVHT